MPSAGRRSCGDCGRRESIGWLVCVRRFRTDDWNVIDVWFDLVMRHSLKGKRVHDVHLLASVMVNDVPMLLTSNPADFPPVPRVEVLSLMRV